MLVADSEPGVGERRECRQHVYTIGTLIRDYRSSLCGERPTYRRVESRSSVVQRLRLLLIPWSDSHARINALAYQDEKIPECAEGEKLTVHTGPIPVLASGISAALSG